MTMATTKKTGSSSRPTNRTSGKDTATKRASDGATSSDGAAEKAAPRRRTSGSAPRATAPKKKSGMVVAREAAQQLLELTGKAAEGVTGFERSDDGWRVEVEVVEVRRIPDTADILALYELSVDEDGELEGYRRLRRYSRGSTGQESG
jgi:hypothetical protein